MVSLLFLTLVCTPINRKTDLIPPRRRPSGPSVWFVHPVEPVPSPSLLSASPLHLDLRGHTMDDLWLGDERVGDEEWLGRVWAATGVLDLEADNLTIIDGILRTLNLSSRGLQILPGSIGQLASLTELDLTGNKVASLPDSIGQLTNLTELHLSGNKIVSLPDSIGQLTSLTVLNLFSNKLASLPESIGKLKSLKRLNLAGNQLASLPESMRKLTNLTELHLYENALIGEVPLWLGALIHLETIDLSTNPALGGSLPSLPCPCSKQNTNISSVNIKIQRVKTIFEKLFVIIHLLIGYLDLLTDVLSIMQFHKQGNAKLMAANIVFLVFNVCVDVALVPDTVDKVLAVLQVQQIVQAFKSMKSMQQTSIFVRSKKVDAICRSVPSIVLQVYGLLATLPALRSSEGFTLILSVVTSVVGSAISLGSLAPKAGFSLLSPRFVVHFCYYVCELTARLLSMSLLFVSIGHITFAVLGADFLMRLFLPIFVERGSVGTNMLSAVLAFGSDGVNEISLEVTLILSSTISSTVLLISLCLINLLDTPDLRVLRQAPGGPVQAVTVLACAALFFKYLIGMRICKMKPQNSYEAVDKYMTREEAQEIEVELGKLRSKTDSHDAKTETLDARTVQLNARTKQLEAQVVQLEAQLAALVTQVGLVDRV